MTQILKTRTQVALPYSKMAFKRLTNSSKQLTFITLSGLFRQNGVSFVWTNAARTKSHGALIIGRKSSHQWQVLHKSRLSEVNKCRDEIKMVVLHDNKALQNNKAATAIGNRLESSLKGLSSSILTLPLKDPGSI